MCTKCADIALKLAAIAYQLTDAPTPFELLIMEFERKAEVIAKQFAMSGNADLWHFKFDELLETYHAKAYAIGAGLDGSTPNVGAARMNGRRIADLESEWLQGFLSDLRGTRYFDDDGVFKIDQVLQRSRMYGQKMRGTANYGFVDVSGPLEQFEWHLGAVEDHCEDCPVLATGGPYTKDTLYTTPGNWDTPCGGNCRCKITRLSDGLTGIPPLNYDYQNAA